MTLSPFEIERREFGRTPMGYKRREVDEFLDEIHRTLSQLWQERGELRETNERLNERIERFEQLEQQLTNTLMLAQDSAEKAHEQARREADLMLKEAHQQSRDIVHAAHEDKQRLEIVLRDLGSAEQEARQRMRQLASAVISHLDDTEHLVEQGSTSMRAIVQAQPDGEIGASRAREAARAAEETADPSVPAPSERASSDAARSTRDGEAAPDAGAREQATDGDDAATVSAPAAADAPRMRTRTITGRSRKGAPKGDAVLEPAGRGVARETASTPAADAFFDDVPSFDGSAMAPPRRERGGDASTDEG